MYDQLIRLASNPQGRDELIAFLSAHHEELRSQHTFTKIQALQAADRVFGLPVLTEPKPAPAPHEFQALKKAAVERQISNDGHLSAYELTLAHKAGWLVVEAPDLQALEAAIAEVKDLVVDVSPVANNNSDRSDVYFLGETIYKSSLADVIRTLTSKRKLWWNADNADEAEEWVKELTEKGATINKMEMQDPKNPKGMIMVVFSIDPKEAARFFGGEENIDPNDYLDEYLERL